MTFTGTEHAMTGAVQAVHAMMIHGLMTTRSRNAAMTTARRGAALTAKTEMFIRAGPATTRDAHPAGAFQTQMLKKFR
jgi:hypothetical protein